jgi:hypothetical protein
MYLFQYSCFNKHQAYNDYYCYYDQKEDPEGQTDAEVGASVFAYGGFVPCFLSVGERLAWEFEGRRGGEEERRKRRWGAERIGEEVEAEREKRCEVGRKSILMCYLCFFI